MAISHECLYRGEKKSTKKLLKLVKNGLTRAMDGFKYVRHSCESG